MSEVDFLVIGQGLAGSAVAMRALTRNYRVLVLDEPAENHSSLVAAGLFNPVTGRKMVKTWLADEIFPCLHAYYREVEQITKRRFFFPMPMYRAFISVEEQNEWMGKSTDEGLRPYVQAVSAGPSYGEKVKDVFGGITLKQSGYLDTRSYLESVRDYLIERNAYQSGYFDAGALKIEGSGVRYGPLKASRVIFCQGVRNRSNPWFGSLPVRPLKGEFLTVQSEWEKDVILNRGVYIVPGSNSGEWRVGATFNFNDFEQGTTPRAREELTRKLEDLVRTPYVVTSQQWGFRPTTPDRKPMLGAHPEFRSLIVFNGLGTKGVSLAPYFSELLLRWMESKGTIGKEADVTRFY